MTAALADRLRKVLETHTQRDLRADFARSDFLRDHGAELLRIVEEHERDREDAERYRWLRANWFESNWPKPILRAADVETVDAAIDAARGAMPSGKEGG